MPYSSTAYQLLISAPGDVSDDDIGTLMETINRWNAIYGKQFGAVVVPTQWKLHSAAEHGGRPQGSLNAQLVEDADILIALFWSRLGSPTGESESGTVEEIETAHENGAYVAILQCSRDFPRDVDTEQLKKLREFYSRSQGNSLMLEYDAEADLARHVDTILNRAVTRENSRAEAAVATPSATQADVWPRVDRREDVDSDSRGRIRTRHRWSLVLSNAGMAPARRVRHRLEPENEDDMVPMEPEADRELEVLPPGGEASSNLMLVVQTASQVRCVVTWEDDLGEHENRATLRFF